MLKRTYINWCIRYDELYIAELEAHGWKPHETKPYRDNVAVLRVRLALLTNQPRVDAADRIVLAACALALIVWGVIELWR